MKVKYIIPTLALAAVTSFKSPSQTTIITNTGNEISLILDQKEIDYDKLVNSFGEDIIQTYGKERGIELINETIIREINKIRKEHGLKEVKKDKILGQVAQKYAKEIYEKNYYAHTNKEGKIAQERVDAMSNGKRKQKVGEIILPYSTRPINAIRGRMDSEKHKAQILNPNRENIGSGVYGGKEQEGAFLLYRVVDFGQPE